MKKRVEQPEATADGDDDDDDNGGKSREGPAGISRRVIRARRTYTRDAMSLEPHTPRTYLPSASAMLVVKGNTGRYGNASPVTGLSFSGSAELRGSGDRTRGVFLNPFLKPSATFSARTGRAKKIASSY